MRTPPYAKPRLARLSSGLAAFLMIVLLTIQPAASLRAAPAPDAGTFLENLSRSMIARITESGIGADEQRKRLRAILDESFSIAAIGQFVLGHYWRSASESERQAFLAVFEESIVEAFLPLFITYSDARLEIERNQSKTSAPDYVIVRSRVWPDPGNEIKVDWRLQADRNQYKIVDVVVEGVSIALTLRSEYTLLIRQQGGNVGALVDRMRESLPRAKDLAATIPVDGTPSGSNGTAAR